MAGVDFIQSVVTRIRMRRGDLVRGPVVSLAWSIVYRPRPDETGPDADRQDAGIQGYIARRGEAAMTVVCGQQSPFRYF